MNNVSELLEKLNNEFNDKLSASEDLHAIYCSTIDIVDFLKALKDSYNYNMLLDITSVDYNDYFEVVYHVMCQDNADILRIKVKLQKGSEHIPSVMSIWKAADVQEREIFDLMGIIFDGRKNLKRILCPDDFNGHPLRKDYKLNIVDRFG